MAILVLIFRRLPIVLTLYKLIPAIKTWREAIFTGWFGPIGVGAIFYYTVALESLPVDGPNAHAREVMKPVIYFMVLSSVIAHGITIPLFYIGTFATRTLTRTSENSGGNPVLHIKKPSLPTTEGDEVIENPLATPHEQRHTAITILTPEDLKLRQDPPSPTITPESLPDDTPQYNTSRRRSHVVIDEEDLTMYLP